MSQNHLFPPIFPLSFACEFGEDRYGLYMAFFYKGVKQVFRWIMPGRFMMGSPEDEKGRFEDEDLHEVRLTNGFWLAETTVTQGLWQAVMNHNPSEFKGEHRPVENVSWDDTQEFIKKLNSIFKDLQDGYLFRMPTDAEWEYACRAGTQTAFNFDGELTLEKVNYRGTWDDYRQYGNGALRETATVKSYPCNDWGLYEMHGNVWEWCQDHWQDNLGKQAVSDPLITNDSPKRVVRGGSWYDFGQVVRSAYRRRLGAGDRSFNLGFRLSLGLQAPVKQVPAGGGENSNERVAEQREL